MSYIPPQVELARKFFDHTSKIRFSRLSPAELFNAYQIGKELAEQVLHEYACLGGDDPGLEDCDHAEWCGFCRARKGLADTFRRNYDE